MSVSAARRSHRVTENARQAGLASLPEALFALVSPRTNAPYPSVVSDVRVHSVFVKKEPWKAGCLLQGLPRAEEKLYLVGRGMSKTGGEY